MSAVREAIVLPLAFLTVTLLGGLRIGPHFLLVPPPLISLVLAVMLLAALVRAGVFAPEVILGGHRTPLENISGLIVLVTLFAASAQVFTLVTPERGLLHAIFSVGFFVQLATTLAGVKGRRNMLRSLGVLLGAAFIVRFIALEGLYATDGGFAKRLLTTLVEGASLGSIQYEPVGAATGYVAFATLAVYMIGLVLLPPRGPRGSLTRPTLPSVTDLAPIAILLLSAGGAGCYGRTATAAEGQIDRSSTTARMREDALASARVWSEPTVPIAQFDFASNPPRGFGVSDLVSCRFVIQKLSGRTQKFHCQLPDGRIVKVKYGSQNAELQAEVAGTRLLSALGFAADDMFVVRAVQCDGCPRFPFYSLQCNEQLHVPSLCFGGPLAAGGVRTFTSAIIERRVDGNVIEAFEDQGWNWYELDRVDPARGATRAEIDAFRLLAVFLAHWDNKGANQRLICPTAPQSSDGRCAAPIAMIQDLGATFGPVRVDLPSWRGTPIWRDRAGCKVSMRALPYNGATFPDATISEAGRTMLLRLLEQLSHEQLRQLFTASRITTYDQIDGDSRNPDAWVNVFEDKVREIREGGPCE